MTTRVRHSATVTNVRNNRMTVNIERSDTACSACAIKGLCSSAKDKTASIDLHTTDADAYSPGDSVSISIEARTIRNPMFWSIILPCLIFVGIIAYGDFNRLDENATALTALLSTSAYYFAYFLTRFVLRNRQVEITLQSQ